MCIAPRRTARFPRRFLGLLSLPVALASLAAGFALPARADDLQKVEAALRNLCSGTWNAGSRQCDVQGNRNDPGVAGWGYSSTTVGDARSYCPPAEREEVTVGGRPAVVCYVYNSTLDGQRDVWWWGATVTFDVKFPNGLPYAYSVTARSDWRRPPVDSNTQWGPMKREAKERAVAHAEVVSQAVRAALGQEAPPLPDTGKTFCDQKRQDLQRASVKARLAAYNLQSTRALVQDLDREWEDRRQAAYWGGTIDIAAVAGSALTRPVAAAIGTTLADQSLQMILIEAAFKGLVKEGSKQYVSICAQQGVDPALVLQEMALKGAGVDTRDKAAQEALQHYLTERIVDKVVAGEMGGLQALQTAAGGVDDTMTGGVSPQMREFVKNEFAAPAAELLATLVSLGQAIDGAWTAHGKLESIRHALSLCRANETLQAREAEAALADLDVARYAFNLCVKDHPGEKGPDDGALSFRPDITPPPPTARKSAAGTLSDYPGHAPSGASDAPPASALETAGGTSPYAATYPGYAPSSAPPAGGFAIPTEAQLSGATPQPGAPVQAPSSYPGFAPSTPPQAAFAPAVPPATSQAPAPSEALGLPCAPAEAFVASLYRSVLEREADAPGLQGFVGRLSSGTSREQVCRDFFGAEEHAGKNKSDREYLRDAYQALLGREPGEPEIAIWLPQLAAGKLSRSSLVTQILGSAEYKGIRAKCP